MESAHVNHLLSKTIYLGSSSPRRQDIFLNLIGLKNTKFKKSNFKENFDKKSFTKPETYVEMTALFKTREVYQQLKNENKANDVDMVIGADSVIVVENIDDESDWIILEKPKDDNHAKEMITLLSSLPDNKIQKCLTSVTILFPREPIMNSNNDDIDDIINNLSFENNEDESIYAQQNFEIRFTEETKIYFDQKLTEQAIDDYVKTGDYKDKAGGYGIQSLGALFVERIDGDFYNVVGFPVCRFVKEIKKLIDNQML